MLSRRFANAVALSARAVLGQSAGDEVSCCARDIPRNFVELFGEFVWRTKADGVHCREDFRFKSGIVCRLLIVSSKTSVAPNDPGSPHDEVTLTTAFAPDRGGKTDRLALSVHTPSPPGTRIEIDDQGFTAAIGARKEKGTWPSPLDEDGITSRRQQGVTVVPVLNLRAETDLAGRRLHEAPPGALPRCSVSRAATT